MNYDTPFVNISAVSSTKGQLDRSQCTCLQAFIIALELKFLEDIVIKWLLHINEAYEHIMFWRWSNSKIPQKYIKPYAKYY